MTDYEFIKILKEKRILDSYQFLTSCKFKLISSDISYKALTNICVEQFNNFDTKREEIFRSVIETGVGKIEAVSDDIDYFGVRIGRNVLVDKLTIEIFSTLHSFFDTYAQWLNAALFANKAKPVKNVTFSNVIDMLDSFSEYNGKFITKLKGVKTSPQYQFISDINNIIKHRFQIYTKAQLNFFDGDKNLMIPKFRKENNSYSEKEVLDIIKDCFDYCNSLFEDFADFIKTHYSAYDNQYVSNRIYNPKTHLVFENYEDAKNMRNVVNSIHFIELDKNNLEQEFRVMLVSNDNSNESLEVYNSVYDFIAVKDISSKEYIGILKPQNSEKYFMDDGRIIEYRNYELKMSGFEQELTFKLVDGNIQVFPLLSDIEMLIINPDINNI